VIARRSQSKAGYSARYGAAPWSDTARAPLECRVPSGGFSRVLADADKLPLAKGRKPTMPTYVMLAKWTDQGIRAIDEASRRLDAAKKILIDMGGQFRSLYMTMGDYDLVAIYDAPDDAVAARFTLLLGKMGSVRTTSMKAFPEEAMRQIIASLA
jgi:uncharacterized protein with GYD domain